MEPAQRWTCRQLTEAGYPCPAYVEEGQKFCFQCGNPAWPPFCKMCRAALPAGAKFCGQCGQRQTVSTVPVAVQRDVLGLGAAANDDNGVSSICSATSSDVVILPPSATTICSNTTADVPDHRACLSNLSDTTAGCRVQNEESEAEKMKLEQKEGSMVGHMVETGENQNRKADPNVQVEAEKDRAASHNVQIGETEHITAGRHKVCMETREDKTAGLKMQGDIREDGAAGHKVQIREKEDMNAGSADGEQRTLEVQMENREGRTASQRMAAQEEVDTIVNPQGQMKEGEDQTAGVKIQMEKTDDKVVLQETVTEEKEDRRGDPEVRMKGGIDWPDGHKVETQEVQSVLKDGERIKEVFYDASEQLSEEGNRQPLESKSPPPCGHEPTTDKQQMDEERQFEQKTEKHQMESGVEQHSRQQHHGVVKDEEDMSVKDNVKRGHAAKKSEIITRSKALEVGAGQALQSGDAGSHCQIETNITQPVDVHDKDQGNGKDVRREPSSDKTTEDGDTVHSAEGGKSLCTKKGEITSAALALVCSEQPAPDMTPYRKPEAPDEYYRGKGGQSEDTKRTEARGECSSKIRMVAVYFHVLVHPGFKYPQEWSHVLVRIDRVGGWKSMDHKLEVGRTLADGNVLMSQMVMIPYGVLTTGTWYKYCLVHQDSRKEVWEHIPYSVNRWLHACHQDLAGEVLTRYDGVMMPEPSMMDKIKKMLRSQKEYKEIVSQAVRSFMPVWEEKFVSDKGCALQTFEAIRQLRSCVRHWTVPLYPENKISCFEEVLKEVIIRRLEAFKSLKGGRKENPDEAAVRLAAAMVIVLLREDFKLTFKHGQYQLLIEALLLRPDTERKTCPDLAGLQHNFQSHWSNLAKRLSSFIEHFISENPRDIKWMWCLPLLHCLSGICQPFDLPPRYYSPKHRDAQWWGTCIIRRNVEKFRKDFCHIDDGTVKHMKTVLTALFSMDRMLPRSVLAGLSKNHLTHVVGWPEMPAEAVLGYFFYLIETGELEFYNIEENLKKLKPVLTRLETLAHADSTSDKVSEPEVLQQLNIATVIIIDLAESVMAKSRHHNNRNNPGPVLKAVEMCAEVLTLRSLNNQQEYLDKQVTHQTRQYASQQTDPSREEDRLMSLVHQWLENWLPRLMFKHDKVASLEKHSEPEVWTRLLKLRIGDDNYTGNWQAYVKVELDQRIFKVEAWQLLDIFAYNEKILKQHPLLGELISQRAFHVAQEAYRRGGHDLERLFGDNATSRGGYLLSRLLCTSWPDSTSPSDDMLKHVIEVPCLKLYLSAYNSPVGQVLTPECQNIIDAARDVLSTFLKNLVSGDLHVSQLKKAFAAQKPLTELLEAGQLWDEEVVSQEALGQILALRKKELGEFDRRKELINAFLFLCSAFGKVEVNALTERLQLDVNEMKLSSLWDPLKLNHKDDTVPQASPEIIFFSLPSTVIEILPQVETLKDSIVFRLIWNHEGKPLFQEIKSNDIQILADITKRIWQPVYKRWYQLTKQFVSGNIALHEVEFLFSDLMSRKEKLKEEIRLMCLPSSSETLVHERVRQLTTWQLLMHLQEAAQVILDVRKTLKLTGSFTNMERVLAVKAAPDSPLSSITEDMAAVGEELKSMSTDQIACLRCFIDCQPLIEWVRENVPGPQDLAAFVDVALIAANGQDGLAVTKVSSLHAAIGGFSPLIYDIKPESGFPEFYRRCKAVWTMLESDPDLPKKLDDVNKELPWLKDLHEVQGEVGVNALKQVDKINSRGIFIVGKRTPGTALQSGADVLRLEVVGEEEVAGNRRTTVETFRMDRLMELHSRLMLVVGRAAEKNEGVDCFREIFDGITGLAASLIKMIEAGNVLFEDWHAKFYCHTNSKFTTVIDFGLSNTKLVGYQEEMNVIKQVSQIREFMDSCLEEWKQYVDQKRREFPELNHFTSPQIVLLRRELATFLAVGAEHPRRQMVLALLQTLRDGCSLDDVQNAVRTAQDTLKSQDEMKEKEFIEERSSFRTKEEEVLWRYSQLYNPASVKRAIEKHGIENETEIELDCMEEQEHPDSVIMDEEAALPPTETLEEMTGRFLESLGNQKSLLRDRLKEMWTNYLQSSLTSLSNFLSIDQLGLCLRSLHQQPNIDRPLPFYLQESQPNLLVCPEVEIFGYVLAVYMDDSVRPMPQKDEVLLCTADTGMEEVLLLLKRAVHDQSGKIYMLVHAELLTYEVAVQVEKAIRKLLLGRSTNYRLVVVCSSEQQHTSTLITALDKYQIQRPLAPSLRRLSRYILQGLQAAPTGLGAYLDPEQSCVRVITSAQAGNGKSLWVRRQKQKIRGQGLVAHSLPLHGRTFCTQEVIKKLMQRTHSERQLPTMYHIDIGPEIKRRYVNDLLFNLVVLGTLMDPTHLPWHRSQQDYYVIEILQELQKPGAQGQTDGQQLLTLLPTTVCRSPEETMSVLQEDDPGVQPKLVRWSQHDQLIDMEEYGSRPLQRVFQYLRSLYLNTDLRDINPGLVDASPKECLETLLQYCDLSQVTWAEVGHFIRFLNVQLTSCELSTFCSPAAEADLPRFLRFVVRFMINMSRDFATRSLTMGHNVKQNGAQAPPDEGPERNHLEDEAVGNETDADLAVLHLERRWETSPHPYIFFNPDQATMTFLGFTVSRPNFDVVEPQNGQVLERRIMDEALYQGLLANGVNLSEDFDKLPRADKLAKLRMVMGVPFQHDPDDNYVLTTDNVKKMLAIHMRFRCGIPVVIMGETGCGKTRLVRFMCQLQCPENADIDNMVQVKVHGGMTDKDLIQKIERAEELAKTNRLLMPGIDTVLFLDEVNTTEALGVVKELLCDRSVNGKCLRQDNGLRLIAACNPYRKHSAEVISRLEQAGLGYHIRAEDTLDKLGAVPMRQLVYRVQPLPQSLRPLVWDFGQLLPDVEKMYIRKIVERKVMTGVLGDLAQAAITIMTDILVAAQEFMRQQQEECSFVSLRDVERTLTVMEWFYTKRQPLFLLMDEKARGSEQAPQHQDFEDEVQELELEELSDGEEREQPTNIYEPPGDVSRALILALSVSYQASLEDTREDFREHVSRAFQASFHLAHGPDTMAQQTTLCQDVLLDSIELGDNIAGNQALKENIFMMVVCIELRIPLFLVGKPGSSKSLAKTIVSNAMLGPYSRSDLFKQFKQVCMVPYQCSPHSTPDGIVNSFWQCAQLQKEKRDLDKFVAVVVLDEVGLAEDSPRMPLKTLHPLLEDGCEGDEKPEDYKKVGFIGISNWALDPAKMNRGILVQRAPPDEHELRDTALDICSSDKFVHHEVGPLMSSLATAYSQLFDEAIKDKREFFGLRDFYSLVKMVFTFAKTRGRKPTWHEIEHAVLRNFGGLQSVRPVEVFKRAIHGIHRKTHGRALGPDNSPEGLIKANLKGEGSLDGESRYLLILTENYAALPILQQKLEDIRNATVIFGSSFPKDQEYVVVCGDINRIKVCMELGETVVLLNLDKLYESLYDALNQYYINFGGQRHVDLGLGSHRVKARVHKDFRLIVVAEKEDVYKKFPTPLINRLEKHFVATSTILTPNQKQLVMQLEDWLKGFIHRRGQAAHHQAREKQVGDVIIGYHPDACAAVVAQVCTELGAEGDEQWALQVLEMSKKTLLWCAVPEAMVCLKQSKLAHEEKAILQMFMVEQKHESLTALLEQKFCIQEDNTTKFVQITTHSRLLSGADTSTIAEEIGLPSAIYLQSLAAFSTEQQFSQLVREYFTRQVNTKQILLIQCDSGDQKAAVIACARFIIMDEYQHVVKSTQVRSAKHIALIIQVPRVAGGSFIGFQGGRWESVHLDELCPQQLALPSIKTLTNKSISCIIGEALPPGLVNQVGPMSQAGSVDQVDERSQRSELQSMHDANEHQEMDFQVVELDKEDDAVDMDGVEVNNGPEEMDQDMDEPYAMDGMHEPGYVDPADQESNKLGLVSLLRSCVHGAVIMLKDSDAELSIKRVGQLLSLLSTGFVVDGGDARFSTLLQLRVYMLLRDKEASTMNEAMAREWLIRHVFSGTAISTVGTFRRCTWQALEQRITPVLAAILAMIDKSNNLSLLNDNIPWKHAMWLSIFEHPQLTPLDYSELFSPDLQTELRERVVPSAGAGGRWMVVALPFSWLLKTQIDTLVDQARQSQGIERVTVTVANLLVQSPWWPVLQAACQEASTEILLSHYMHDFVCMVYTPHQDHAEQEIHLVTRALDAVLMQMICQSTKDNSQPQGIQDLLPMVHLAEADIHYRLQLFSQLVQQHPDIIVDLSNFLNHYPENPLASTKEMTLDMLAITLLVRRIHPTETLLRDQKKIGEWQHNVDQIAPLVSDALARVRRMKHQDGGGYGEICEQSLSDIQKEWIRLSTVKMFATIVCPRGSEEEGSIHQFCPLLHKRLTDVNFKSGKTLCQIDKFLRQLTWRAAKRYLGVDPCQMCKEASSMMLRLPCGHSVCENCITMLQTAGDSTCPECRLEYTDYITTKDENREQIDKLDCFKHRCNAFLLEVVSKMCFADNSPPDASVIEHIMTYITGQHRINAKKQTKYMSLYNEQWDPTPVVRSALLQLLLRSSLDDVRGYLKKYFDLASEMMVTVEDHVELCLLYVQCLEDHFHVQADAQAGEEAILKLAAQLLRSSHDDFGAHRLCMLEVIAKLRYGLSIAAQWIGGERLAEGTVRPAVLEHLVMAAKMVCNTRHMEGPRLYLARMIGRRFGVDTLLRIARRRDRSWVLPAHTDPVEAVRQDWFVICGEAYARSREAINTSLVEGKMDSLSALLEDADNHTIEMNRCLMLALSRHVTMCFADRNRPQLEVEAGNLLKQAIREAGAWLNQDLAGSLIENSLATQCPQLLVTTDLTRQHLDILELMTHFMASLPILETKQLLQPLVLLATNPAATKGNFLPTMPEDIRARVHEALLAARHDMENPSLYECPNGHPYYIGNVLSLRDMYFQCGRPATTQRCLQCMQPIGGANYQPAPGNRKVINLTDQTKPGHNLGAAEMLSNIPTPERNLSGAAKTLLRLLVHIALFTAANKQLQDTHALITPAVREAEVADFLWQHLLHDMEMLARALRKSADDCILLVHLLIHILCTQPDAPCQHQLLRTKDERQQWENIFAAHILTPLLSDVDTQLQGANQQIANDAQAGTRNLLRLIHEVDPPQANIDPQQVEAIPAMWRYRVRVTVEHLKQTLTEIRAGQAASGGQSKYALLHLFLEKEPLLREVQKLPQLIRLTTWMVQHYQRKIDRIEAEKLHVKDFLLSIDRGDEQEVRHLMEQLQTAWHVVKDQLTTHEYCEMDLSWETSLSALLPSLRGQGRRIMALLHYLATVHNEFMVDYSRISHQRLGPEVSFPDLQPQHLIVYDLEADLLPMVVSNCGYSLKVGQGTSITYNMGQLEQQLEERFMRGRAGIHFQIAVQVGDFISSWKIVQQFGIPRVSDIVSYRGQKAMHQQLPPLIFREDMTNATLFNQLAKKIPQVPLPAGTQTQICKETRYVVEVSDCLAALDVSVGFLVSVGGKPDTMLHTFMTDILQMDAGVLMPKARNNCQLQHLRDLWLVLSHHREKMTASYGQVPFTSVDCTKYMAPLSEDEEAALHNSLHRVDRELLLSKLYEFIILHLTVPRDENDEDYVDNRQHKLTEVLYMYIEDQDGPEIPGLLDLPDMLKVEQSVAVWSSTEAFIHHRHYRIPKSRKA